MQCTGVSLEKTPSGGRQGDYTGQLLEQGKASSGEIDMNSDIKPLV